MQAETGDGGKTQSSDYNLWRICRETDAADDEAARFLDRAAFAEDRLDEDERERVAAAIDGDAEAMADVAAARLLAGAAIAPAPAAVIARAVAAHPDAAAPARIIPFPLLRRGSGWQGVADWASLAAAVLVAGWLGFNLGIGAWSDYTQINQSRDEPLRELLDPSAGFMRDLTEAART